MKKLYTRFRQSGHRKKRRRSIKKLRTRFLLQILAPAIVIMVITGIISYIIARSILIDEMTKLSTVGLHQAVDELETGAWRGLQTLANLFAVERTLHPSDPELKKLFTEIQKGLAVEAIFMGFPDGRFVSSMDQSVLPKDYDPRKQSWYERALKQYKPVVTPLRLSKLSWKQVITVSAQVTDPQGKFIGVMGYNVPFMLLQEKIAGMKLVQEYSGTRLSIFKEDGLIIMNSYGEMIGGNMGDLQGELDRRLWSAVRDGYTSWQTTGESGENFYYAGFQETSLPGIYVAILIPMHEAIAPIVRLLLALVFVGLVAVVVLTHILIKHARKLAEPINMLADAARRLSQGDYEQKLPVASDDELGSLTEAFNTMTEGLRQRDFIRNTLGRYVTEEVADKLLESEDGLRLGGETRDVSILMSDLRGFTAHTADMAPERVLFFLNRYLAKMVAILLDHNAVVDEIVGDGILAIFGAPTDMEDHPQRAVACALRMQAAMDSINAVNEADGLPRIEMGIGVNTGKVVVGNIGSERRTKYGVVGAEANFAGRIESYTLGGQVLISESTLERVKGLVAVRDVIQVEMKGLHGPVSLFDVRAIRGPYEESLPETLETPMPISKRIPVIVRLLKEKIVARTEESAFITHLGEASAVIRVPEELVERAEIRIDLLDDDRKTVAGEVFAKVISTRPSGETYGALVRFTFVSPEIRRFFRRVYRTQAA